MSVLKFVGLIFFLALHEARERKGMHLEVFDMDGNPVARYELQGERPRYFAVDEETFTLYSPLNGLPEDHLLIYKLEGLE